MRHEFFRAEQLTRQRAILPFYGVTSRAQADLRLDGLAALPETLGKASPALRTGWAAT